MLDTGCWYFGFRSNKNFQVLKVRSQLAIVEDQTLFYGFRQIEVFEGIIEVGIGNGFYKVHQDIPEAVGSIPWQFGRQDVHCHDQDSFTLTEVVPNGDNYAAIYSIRHTLFSVTYTDYRPAGAAAAQ